MMSSVAEVRFIKTKVFFRYHTKGVSNQVSSYSDHIPKWEKTKKWEKMSGLQNGAIRGLKIGADFTDYKFGQERLQIKAAFWISNRGKKITNQGRDFKLGQRDFKSEQTLQIGQEGFQIGAGITNRCRTILV